MCMHEKPGSRSEDVSVVGRKLQSNRHAPTSMLDTPEAHLRQRKLDPCQCVPRMQANARAPDTDCFLMSNVNVVRDILLVPSPLEHEPRVLSDEERGARILTGQESGSVDRLVLPRVNDDRLYQFSRGDDAWVGSPPLRACQ
jgi:hypothetical protein